MSELTTKTGTQVANEVKRQFGDQDGIQINDDDILNWLNDGQRQIVAVNPILQGTLVHDIVGGSNSYSFPADRIQYIQTLFYKGTDGISKPLTQYSYQEAIEYIAKPGITDALAEKAVPQIWWSWGQKITLFPAPAQSVTGGLVIDYIGIPVELAALTETLSVPDRYFDTLVNYVLSKARALDETYDAANYHKGLFEQQLGQLSEQENKITVQQYPAPLVRADDAW
jgi:hypothetical protein